MGRSAVTENKHTRDLLNYHGNEVFDEYPRFRVSRLFWRKSFKIGESIRKEYT